MRRTLLLRKMKKTTETAKGNSMYELTIKYYDGFRFTWKFKTLKSAIAYIGLQKDESEEIDFFNLKKVPEKV